MMEITKIFSKFLASKLLLGGNGFQVLTEIGKFPFEYLK